MMFFNYVLNMFMVALILAGGMTYLGVVCALGDWVDRKTGNPWAAAGVVITLVVSPVIAAIITF